MDFLAIIRETVAKEFAFPTLVKVTKCTCSASGYSIDGQALLPGTLEATKELFKEIPISPIWADKDGRGLYAPPAVGQIVVVSYIGGNKAFPFVAGIYAETYKPKDGVSNKHFSLLDGQGEEVSLFPDQKLMTIKNSTASLKQILTDIVNAILGIKISGGLTDKDQETLVTPAVLDGSVTSSVSSIISSEINKLFKE